MKAKRKRTATKSKTASEILKIESSYTLNNDPKLQKFLLSLGTKLKKHGSQFRVNAYGTYDNELKHLTQKREECESQMRLLDNALTQMAKWREKHA